MSDRVCAHRGEACRCCRTRDNRRTVVAEPSAPMTAARGVRVPTSVIATDNAARNSLCPRPIQRSGRLQHGHTSAGRFFARDLSGAGVGVRWPAR